MNGSFENKREVTGIALFFLAIALTLLYYLPSEVTGVLGRLIRTFGGGLIGSAAFVIPLFLVYASVDFFLEKREGVSPIRIRSVIIFLICLSSLLCIATVDFDHFRSLCLDEADQKFKASKAISLLWRSGSDYTLISMPDKRALPGGILGGLLAVALHTVCGNVTSVVVLIGLIASQIILVFHISLKSTVKKTAAAVGNAVRSNGARRSSARPSYKAPNPHPSNARRYKSSPYTSYPASEAPSSRANSSSLFVNSPVPEQRSRVHFDDSSNVYDAFNRSLPVDSKSGFADMTDPAFAADTKGEQGILKYGERRVSTDGINDSGADFSYDSMPRTSGIRRGLGSIDEPDFLKKKAPLNFYDLSGGVYPEENESSDYDADYNSDYSEKPAAGGYYRPEDDMPYEVDDDSYYEEKPKVRRPNLASVLDEEPVKDPVSDLAKASKKDPGDEASLTSQVITINNSGDDTEGYTAAEGRIIDTSAARKTAGGVEISSSSAAREGKRIKANGYKDYKKVPLSLLASDPNKGRGNAESEERLREKAEALQNTLRTFGITDARVSNITHGPAITRFEVTIGAGVKVSKVKSLEDDIALAMAATAVRIEAPIPGKRAIGIEIPNEKTSAVYLRTILETEEFKGSSPLNVGLGKDIPGKPIYCDIAKMPHLLVAGATGSGKSVCVNSILMSILCKASPKNVKMILIDPKVVELSVYDGIPHLLMPVVTDMKIATGALKWAVAEMERRYKLFAEKSVRNMDGYNKSLKNDEEPLPFILIIIDELADLMAVAKQEVEVQIGRLAAMARAAGMHMIIATQRPSVDVLTGVIKSNVPSRIAFAVASGVDSRTILDSYGAEKLLGKGDMLYAPNSAPKPIRGQGAFVSDGEVEAAVDYLKQRYGALYDQDINEQIERIARGEGSGKTEGVSDSSSSDSDGDDLLSAAVETVIQAKNASVSILQRRLGVGYPRAARLIDVLEKKGYIGPFEGSKPRKVLITETDWLEIKAKGEDK